MYTVGAPPLSDRPDEIVRVVWEELRRIEVELTVFRKDFVVLTRLHSEPGKVEDGMVARADGVDWNPGAGEGVYVYVAGTGWTKL